jgi:UDP-3-O-[3-hydroxymyristoyl] glucosamine N-acyltransferase
VLRLVGEIVLFRRRLCRVEARALVAMRSPRRPHFPCFRRMTVPVSVSATVHPSAVVARSAELSDGCVIGPFAVVEEGVGRAAAP